MMVMMVMMIMGMGISIRPSFVGLVVVKSGPAMAETPRVDIAFHTCACVNQNLLGVRMIERIGRLID